MSKMRIKEGKVVGVPIPLTTGSIFHFLFVLTEEVCHASHSGIEFAWFSMYHHGSRGLTTRIDF
jgi:hypothetical protein